MNFKAKKINTKTLAENLLALRKKAGFSLVEAAHLTNVQAKHLLALESADFNSLPADVYVKGYLRALATLYQTEYDWLIDQYLSEKGVEKNVQSFSTESEKKSKTKPPGWILTPRTLTIFGALVLGLVSIGYLFVQVRTLSASPSLELFSPAEDGTVNEGLLIVRGKTEAGSSVFINNQPIVVDVNGNFFEQLSLAPGSNQLVILSQNKFGRETVTTRSIVYQEKAVAGSFTVNEEVVEIQGSTGEEDAASLGEDQFQVKIVIEEEAAWLRVFADGELAFSGTMLPNSQRTVIGGDEVTVTSGNAGTTRVFVNGEDQGLLGDFGEVVRDLVFTK